MNRTTLILGAGTLVCGSASAYLYADLHETRVQSVALQARVAELENRREEGRRAGAQQPDIPVNPFGPPAADEVPPPPRAMASSAPPPAPKPVQQPLAMIGASGNAMVMDPVAAWERSRKLFENPEYRDAMKRQQKMMMPRMYPDLQAALQLDPQSADELFDLLADQQTRSMTTSRPPFSSPGTVPDPEAMREWQTQQQRLQNEKEAEIVALLGDAKLQQWKDYQTTMPARSQVRELRSTLESAGLPLQQDQAEKLISAVAAEQQRAAVEMQAAFSPVGQLSGVGFRSVGPTGPAADRAVPYERHIERTKQQQQRLHAAAAPHLTPQQLDYFDSMQAAQLEMLQINLKMMRAQAEAESRGDAPPVNQINQAFPGPGTIAER